MNGRAVEKSCLRGVGTTPKSRLHYRFSPSIFRYLSTSDCLGVLDTRDAATAFLSFLRFRLTPFCGFRAPIFFFPISMSAGNRPQRDRKWRQAWQTTANKVEFSRPIDSYFAKAETALLDPNRDVHDKRCAAFAGVPQKLRQNCVSQCRFLRVIFPQRFLVRKL